MKRKSPELVRVYHRAGKPKSICVLSDRAKKIFNDVCTAFAPSKSMASVDGGIVTRYAVTLDDWLTESQKLKTEGYVIETGPHRTKVRNPRQSCVKSLAEELARCEKALGFTPEARGKLTNYALL